MCRAQFFISICHQISGSSVVQNEIVVAQDSCKKRGKKKNTFFLTLGVFHFFTAPRLSVHGCFFVGQNAVCSSGTQRKTMHVSSSTLPQTIQCYQLNQSFPTFFRNIDQATCTYCTKSMLDMCPALNATTINFWSAPSKLPSIGWDSCNRSQQFSMHKIFYFHSYSMQQFVSRLCFLAVESKRCTEQYLHRYIYIYIVSDTLLPENARASAACKQLPPSQHADVHSTVLFKTKILHLRHVICVVFITRVDSWFWCVVFTCVMS